MPRFHTAVALIAAAAATVAAMPAHAQAAAPAATSSNVVIYGLIDAVVRRASNVSATGDSIWSMEDGIFTGSRFGFRGTEDLGGGLRAVFTMESGFDPSSGGSLQGTTTADYGQEAINPRFWGREVHLALRGDWGGVTLGRQYTVAHQIAARFQPLGNPNNVALSVFSSHHVARQDNVLRLDGKLGDVELQVARTFGEQAASSSANGSWAVGAGYTKDALSLGAYVQQMENRAGTEKRKIVGLGGNVKLNPMFTLFAGYMQRSAEVSPQENKVWALGANVELSPLVTLSVEYFDDKQSGSTALEGARKVAWVTANYRFSRRTDVYAEIDHNKVDGGYAKPAFMGTLGSQTALGLGLRHRF